MIKLNLTRDQVSMLISMLEFAKKNGLVTRERKKADVICLILVKSILAQEPKS